MFAVHPETDVLLYDIARKKADGKDTDLYWYDRNVMPKDWKRFPDVHPRHNEEVSYSAECKECGQSLTCEKCDPPTCEDCGTVLTKCPECEEKAAAPEYLRVFDEVRIQEELLQIDPNVLRSMLVEQVGSFGNPASPWPLFLKNLLDEAAEDTSSVELNISDERKGEEQPDEEE